MKSVETSLDTQGFDSIVLVVCGENRHERRRHEDHHHLIHYLRHQYELSNYHKKTLQPTDVHVVFLLMLVAKRYRCETDLLIVKTDDFKVSFA